MSIEAALSALPPYRLEDRQAAVRDAMAEAGLDRLLVASTGLHMIDVPNPLFHLTGFRSVGPCFALMERTGAMRALGAPADDAERIACSFPAGGQGTDDLEPSLDALLASSAGRAGIVGLDRMPRRLTERVLLALGDQAVSFDRTFDGTTAVKTSREIANALEATRIAEEGYDHLRALARPGMRECDLAVSLNLFMKGRGADDSFLMLNAGPRSDAVMPSSERPLERGDLILVELSPSVGGQFVQICRTCVVGEPASDMREAYELLVRAMRAGIAQAKPGAPTGAACRAIDDLLSEAGFEAFSRPPFIRRRGHGLGAGSTVPGDVAVDNETRLQPGMLLIVHPNQFLPQTGYMMCGEPLVVGPEGPIVLSREQASLGRIEVAA